MKYFFDAQQDTIERRAAVQVGKALLQGLCFAEQTLSTTWLGQQCMDKRFSRIDTVAHLVHISEEVKLIATQGIGCRCKWGWRNQHRQLLWVLYLHTTTGFLFAVQVQRVVNGKL